ncbi:hypothetical protein BU14_0333s0036 [Porphyra umbilicalis]|uniref:phosphoglucomutase (alpha-D-glucose-1,6-bisphosphate-dependent) n=1 Tax=Porphyra umbilicalis TaxID=2786 RepID=A0A1X6NYH1_PORUM|nr:hypothetical protein BU14_0333s0036 [Porphyra umbilicalis]|eukprot:OSX73648.1 hypothetical protein BU14_0333s0036 [Porphyra umbilicalis]
MALAPPAAAFAATPAPPLLLRSPAARPTAAAAVGRGGRSAFTPGEAPPPPIAARRRPACSRRPRPAWRGASTPTASAASSTPPPALPTLPPAVAGAVVSTPTTPIDGQTTGTSGLRKPTATLVDNPAYLPNLLQAYVNALGPATTVGARLVVGGDGRYYNATAVQTVLRVAAAAGFAAVTVGAGGLLSTPALAGLVVKTGAVGGVGLTASHNAAGLDGDWGIKFQGRNGGPAPEALTDRIVAATRAVTVVRAVDFGGPVNVATPGVRSFFGGAFVVDVVDPTAAYVDRLAEVYDFDVLRSFVATPGFAMRFDAMSAVTGPYAKALFVDTLGLPPSTILRGTPLEDFGGGHPDPSPAHTPALVAALADPAAGLLLGAASDGDGDRNLIVGPDFFVTPADSLAVLTEFAGVAIPWFANRPGGLPGVARSMPTAPAVDRVAAALRIPVYETPTGWKYFGSLLDAGRIALCGEESFGTSGDHVAEKDGLWAVCGWLAVLATASASAGRLVGVADVVRGHWARHGRTFSARWDYIGVPGAAGRAVLAGLRDGVVAAFAGVDRPPPPPPVGSDGDDGVRLDGATTLVHADEFAYTDPVDGAVAAGQGIRLFFADGSRGVLRLSGTDATAAATLRVYLDAYRPWGEGVADADPADVLGGVGGEVARLARLEELTGRVAPTAVV